MSYVICPVTVTSPAPDRPDLFEPNQQCGERCEVHKRAPLMEFRCPVGHVFTAQLSDMVES